MFRELEWKVEEKEREERRKNIVIRGMADIGERDKEGVEELFRGMGIEEGIETVRKVGGRRDGGSEAEGRGNKKKSDGNKEEVGRQKRENRQ